MLPQHNPSPAHTVPIRSESSLLRHQNHNSTRKIISLLSEIEQEFNVRILFVCDAGSRAMNIHDQSEMDSSDYDVRFVYVHPLEWYLRVVDEVDLEIRKKVMTNLKGVNDEETEIDFVGYELRKTLSYTKKSNPTVMEWFVQSDIIYYCYNDSWLQEVKEFWSHYYFNIRTIVYHYLNVAKDNYVDYLRNKPEVNRKKYIYILRCLLWIEHARLSHFLNSKLENNDTSKHTSVEVDIPPFKVDELLNQVLDKQLAFLQTPEEIKSKYPATIHIFEKQAEALNELQILISRKKQSSGQWEKEKRIEVLDDWIFFLRTDLKVFADKVLSKEKRRIDEISLDEQIQLQQRFDTMFYQTVTGFDTLIPKLSTVLENYP
ncbi:hypothetical protein C9374_002427 [Naegleria lovaniensis]|uniref:Nucleotidyltransferase n=1 Tax=Naegleria lovaniensis TaxID=51637 RepID=A0AA88GVF1_NAELO|nr:uncharacterized protein C9374_002427 [Naegleria lovaniensis]KAG2386683.1 hypothetical protein C9374_002427 [Naegleria lovaniensis]